MAPVKKSNFSRGKCNNALAPTCVLTHVLLLFAKKVLGRAHETDDRLVFEVLVSICLFGLCLPLPLARALIARLSRRRAQNSQRSLRYSAHYSTKITKPHADKRN